MSKRLVFSGIYCNIAKELVKIASIQQRKKVTFMHFDDKETKKLAKSFGFRVAK